MSQNLHYGADKHLFLADIDLHKISTDSSYDGPVYVYSQKIIQSRIDLFKTEMSKSLKRFSVHYAVKANSHDAILRQFLKNDFGADVVSFGEMKKAMAAGFPGSKIIFSGVGKSVKEIRGAIANNVEQFNVESLNELQRIDEIARGLNKKINVVLRLNPDVDAKTHPYISTGFKENKFGIDEESLKDCVSFLKTSQGLNLEGLSCHIGSQLHDLNSIEVSIQKLQEIYLGLQAQGFKLKKLDVGGGLGIFYDQEMDQDDALLKKYAAIVAEKFKNFDAHVQFEPGRFLTARAGVLLAKIEYIKQTPYKIFLILNSGMNHLIRPALYEAYHRILPVEQKAGTKMVVDVVGPICESSDFFAKSRQMDFVQEGDWLAIGEAGAYGFSMASTYNAFDLPRELFI